MGGAEQLGDWVRHLVMVNEPVVCAYLGHFLGVHAPGMKSKEAFLATTHHLNLAAGQGLTALRTQGGDWHLGTVVNMGLGLQYAGADSSGAVLAMEDKAEAIKLHDEILYWPFLAPLLLCRYAEAIKNRYPHVPPIYITGDGAAVVDTVESDGSINDRERTEYIQEHLGAIADARQAGVDVRGYFVWSLLDNFEWAYGYDRRFGLTYVDYTTQERTPKASFSWYQQFIKSAKES